MPRVSTRRHFALGGLVVAILSGCSLLPEERVDEIPTLIEPPPSRVVTYPVERMTLQEEIRGLGRVAPTLEENMYFRQSGRVARVEVQPGQTVKKGDVLVQLETGSLEHDLQSRRDRSGDWPASSSSGGG